MENKITPKLVKKVIDEWESTTDTNQYRDCCTNKELNEYYKKIADSINNEI